MRKIVFLFLVVAMVFSCKNKTQAYHYSKPDTLFTIKTFVQFPTKNIVSKAVYRITKDSMVFLDKDSLTKVKQPYRDTTYFIPIGDSLRYVPTLKGSVYEGEDLLKAINTLQKWIADHREYWPDTTRKQSVK